MNTKIRLSLLNWVAAVLLALPSIASATILATNSFEDNTLGALSGQGGGFGWTGNWTAPGGVIRADVVDTTSNPLVYAIPGGATINGDDQGAGGCTDGGSSQPALRRAHAGRRRSHKPSTSVTWCATRGAALGLAPTTPSRCIWAPMRRRLAHAEFRSAGG